MRDSQTVPAATFDHFDFFFPGLAVRFFFLLVRSSILVFFFFTGSVFHFGFFFSFFFFPLVRSSVLGFYFILFYFLFFILASVSLGIGKKKKLYQPTGIDPQIVWKILSDGNWVMMPNGCEKLSDKWWKLSDQKNEAKQPLRIQR